MKDSQPNPVKKKKPTNYIDNKKFYTEMVVYRRLCDEAAAAGEPRPIVSRYIGECIMMIATRLATRPNFVGYSYKDEMISDGIENCLVAVDKFDPSKSSNPFAYYTQIIYFAFVRRIQKEKKQMYVKYKSTEQFGIMEESELMGYDDVTVKPFELYDNISEFIENFEETRKKKKEAKKVKGIEKFLEE